MQHLSPSRPFGWRPPQRLARWLDRHTIPESAVIMFTALVVGVGAGLGAVLFRRLIDGVQALAFEGLGGLLEGIAPYHLLVIPALGAAIFGPMIYRFAREAKGHGVPEVMEAVALRGGRIRPRVALVKALASSICIGTGGRVSEIHLPQECLLVSVRRGHKLHIAHGYTVLQAGDRVTIFADDECLPTVRQCLTGESAEQEERGIPT